MASASAPDKHFWADRLYIGAFSALLICAPIFVLLPQTDSNVAAAFFKTGGGLLGNDFATVAFARKVFKLIYVAACVVAVAGFLCCSATRSSFLWLRRWQHLFLITCLAAGPGVLTNLTFKDHWGRARPRDVVAFGGHKAFTPALMPARECDRNCSFVSGEASSMFMVFFAIALVLPAHSSRLVLAGLLAGTTAGAIRISQGGHFLSDVVFAGILMALTAVVVHRLFHWRTHE